MLPLLASLLFARNIIRVQGATEECALQGQTPARNSGTHNFVIDGFDGENFPYALGQCTATSLNPDKWYKYSCADNSGVGQWIVTKREYTDSQCSGDGTLVVDWDSSIDTSQTYFECEGSNSYLQIELGVNGCDNPVTVYVGLASCLYDNDDDYSIEFYCNDSMALVNYFGSFGNETLMSTTNLPMPSTTNLPMPSTTALPLSSTNVIISSTLFGTSTDVDLDLNMSTTDFDIDLNLTTTNLDIDLNLTSTNFPISSSFLPTFSTRFLSTLLSTIMPTFSTSESENMCDDSEFCNVWVWPKDSCILARQTALQNNAVYAKMKKCGVSKSQQSTAPAQEEDKAGSIHSLTISAIVSVLLAVYWL